MITPDQTQSTPGNNQLTFNTSVANVKEVSVTDDGGDSFSETSEASVTVWLDNADTITQRPKQLKLIKGFRSSDLFHKGEF